jgi:hypothetical protein
VVEAKTVAKHVFERDWDGQPPTHYYLQALANAVLYDAVEALLAVLVVDSYSAELRQFGVVRHPGAEGKMLQAVAVFWQSVERKTEPVADYVRDGDLITTLRPPTQAETIDLSGDNRLPMLLAQYERLTGERKAVDEQIDAIRAEVIDKLAGHEAGVCDGFKLSNKVQHRKAYTVEASSRAVLRITKMKESNNG